MDTNTDRFYADMNDYLMEDTMDDMEAADRDYTPVPREYWGMSWFDILGEIAEDAAERQAEEEARNERRAEYWR